MSETYVAAVLEKQSKALAELDAHIEEAWGKLDRLGDDITAANQAKDHGMAAVLQGEYKRLQAFLTGLRTARSYL